MTHLHRRASSSVHGLGHGAAGANGTRVGEMRDRIAAKHGYADGAAFDPPGAARVNLRLVPTRIIEH